MRRRTEVRLSSSRRSYAPRPPPPDFQGDVLGLVKDRVMSNVMEGVEVELQGFRAANNVSPQDLIDVLVQSLIQA